MVISFLVANQTPLERFNLFTVTAYTEYPPLHSDTTQIYITSTSIAISCRNWIESFSYEDLLDPEISLIPSHSKQPHTSHKSVFQFISFLRSLWSKSGSRKLMLTLPIKTVIQTEGLAWGLQVVIHDRRTTLNKFKLTANKLTVQF